MTRKDFRNYQLNSYYIFMSDLQYIWEHFVYLSTLLMPHTLYAAKTVRMSNTSMDYLMNIWQYYYVNFGPRA